MSTKLRSAVLNIFGFCMWLPILMGALVCAFDLADLYMVTIGGIKPGEPSYMGDPAPTLGACVLTFAYGAALIGIGSGIRTMIRKRLRTSSSAGGASPQQ